MADAALKSAALRAAARLGAFKAPAASSGAGLQSTAEAGARMLSTIAFGDSLAERRVARQSPLDAEASALFNAEKDDDNEHGKGKRRGHLSSEATGEGLKHVFDAHTGGLLYDVSHTNSATAMGQHKSELTIAVATSRLSAMDSVMSKAVSLSNGVTAPKVADKPRFPRKGQETSAGPGWFNLPAQDITPELKRELLILRNRSFLDPKRHYKTAREDRAGDLPKFFAVGTVVEGPHEKRSAAARQTNKERKSSLVAALMSDSRFEAYAARTMSTVHTRALAGGVGAYKKRKAGEAAGRPSAKRAKNR